MKLFGLILFTIFLSGIHTMAQEEQNGPVLKHMLKKSKSDSLIYAGDQLLPQNFLIQIPDSVYSSSQIEIKKFKLASVGKMNLFLKSNRGYFYKTRYQIKGHRKADKFLRFLLEDLNISKKELESGNINIEGKKVSFQYDISGKYHYFIFTSEVKEVH